MINLDFFQNLDLLSVGVAIAAIGILGFVIYLNNRQSITGRAFLLFALVTIFWSVVNYLQYSILEPQTSLWVLRLVMFFATWHAFSIFQLFYVFPKDQVVFPESYKWALLPLVAVTSISTLTPLVFESVAEVSASGELLRVNNGPAIALFAFLAVSLIVSAVYLLIKKMRSAPKSEKAPFRFVFTGTAITFVLLLIFNFVLPAFFYTTELIPLGPVFLLPFVLYTFYAIFKHRILDVKVVSTEIISFFVVIAAFSQILLSKSIGETVFQSAVFITLFIFSVLLIRGVIREIKQREQLEILSKELAAANAELKKLDQLKSDFLSFVSHQLRAPLTVIKGYISMIEEGTYGQIPQNIMEVLGKVFISNEKLIRLVNDFLNLSRIEQGRVQFEFAKASLVSLVDEAVDALKDNAAKRGLRLLWQKPEGILDITIDKSKVYEIIYNLIDNAIKYTEKGEVKVGLEKEPKSLVISVSDTGVGISRGDIDKLFQRFGRIEAGKKVNVSGAGIGLFVAKYMVEAHKGRIWAESKGPGKGSTFFVELPMV